MLLCGDILRQCTEDRTPEEKEWIAEEVIRMVDKGRRVYPWHQDKRVYEMRKFLFPKPGKKRNVLLLKHYIMREHALNFVGIMTMARMDGVEAHY